MAKFGGEMRFTINGRPLVLRGTFNTGPANLEIEGIVNQDNSVSTAAKPKAYTAEVTFEDAAELGTWDALLRLEPGNMSIIEDHTGVVHTYTRAVFTGTPSVNRLNGEVSGLTIMAPIYRTSRG